MQSARYSGTIADIRIRNGARMRPTQFSADTVLALLRMQTVASLPDVLVALGPRVSRRTAFRKLQDLDARTSYSHRGGYYTLDELADFDERGLWSFAGVRFSRAGTPRRNRRGVRPARRGRTLRRRVGQPAPRRHPGRAAQARRRREADPAQARRPVPLLCARPRATDPPAARPTAADGHPRTRAAATRRRPDAGGAARRHRVVRQPARRAAAASVCRPRIAQVRVGRRPPHRHPARHRPVDGRRRPAAARRPRCRGRPGAARGRRSDADGKKRRKSSPASKP